MKSILIADDDSAIRGSLGRVLTHCGYSVTFAEDGQQAQEQLLSGRTDLLILDLEMPIRDGWDVLEDLQTIDPTMPVIVLTGMMDQLHSFELHGVDVLMSKPADVESLLATIERLLAHGSKRRETSMQEAALVNGSGNSATAIGRKKPAGRRAANPSVTTKPRCV